MTGAVIQARMGSTRLPGKVLMSVGGRNILEHIFERISLLNNDVLIVVATSEESNSDAIADFCAKIGVECFRGSESNVLDRYYKLAVKYNMENIIRLTADNPFYDIEELDALIDQHIKSANDFTDSFPVLPIGAGAEIFSFEALKTSYEKSSQPHHFEHLDEYLLENRQNFRTGTLTAKADKCFPDVRLTIDTREDYKRACYIVNHSDDRNVTTQGAVRLAKEYEEFVRNNLHRVFS